LFSGKFAPKSDIHGQLEKVGIESTLNFLSGTRDVTVTDSIAAGGSGTPQLPKESPLWIFPVADNLNSPHQIDLLEENISSMHMTKDPTVTYPRSIHVRILDPYELTESDAPGFLFIISIMRVTLPYLIFRENSVTWPYIRGVTETLPLSISALPTEGKQLSTTGASIAKSISTTPTKQTNAKTSDHVAKKGKATGKI